MTIASGSVELGSDEGAFVIRAASDALTCSPWDESTLVSIPEDLYDGNDVLVLTGAQWGPFSVTTRLLDGPALADEEWEDVVEFSLTSGGEVVVTELVNNFPTVTLLTDPGSYRVRVSARGRASDSARDSGQRATDELATVPIEHYLVEAWLAEAAPPVITRETSRFAREALTGPAPEPEIEGAAAGLAGSRAIGRDVDGAPGARQLSGNTGSLTISRTMPGTRRKLFKYLRGGPTMSRHIPSWGYWGGGEQLGAPTYSSASRGHPDQLSGDRGSIRNTITEEDTPRRRVQHWAWLVPPGHDRAAPEESTVAADTTITALYTQARSGEGLVSTTIEIHHSGLPIEWVEEMRAWWAYQLAFVEHVATGG